MRDRLLYMLGQEKTGSLSNEYDICCNIDCLLFDMRLGLGARARARASFQFMFT